MNKNISIRIGLCCKDGLFGDAVAALVDQHENFEIVATERTAKGLINAAKTNHAQMFVVDSQGLDRDDLQFLLGARAFGEFAIVLICSDTEHDEFADAPVDKLVLRNEPASKLFSAMEELGAKVSVNRPYIRETRRTYGSGNDLTRREFEVAQLIAKGMSNRRISQVTQLREQSVKNLVSVIMRKLQCENRVQVALKLTKGVLIPDRSEE